MSEQLHERVNYWFEQQGYNCAQAAAIVIAEQTGMDILPFAKMLNGFGGGIAGSRNVCGALTGAIAAICMARGNGESRAQDLDAFNKTNDYAKRMFAAFEEKFSTSLCCELTGVKRGAEEARIAFAKDGHARVCNPCVYAACEIALQILNDGR